MTDTRQCRRCHRTLPITAFRTLAAPKIGWRRTCRACENARDRQRYQDQREQILERQRARIRPFQGGDAWRRSAYGLQPEAFEEMRRVQADRCAICRDEIDLVVDHDHDTGDVRGLLCSPCNLGIGLLRDEAVLASRAAAYLERPKGPGATFVGR